MLASASSTARRWAISAISPLLHALDSHASGAVIFSKMYHLRSTAATVLHSVRVSSRISQLE